MTLTAFRLANWDTPLWIGPNRRASRFVADGQIAQYWALHPMTPWAEVLRFHDVRVPDEARELLLRPWVAEIELPDGTVEVNFNNAEDHGIAPDALVDDDHRRCQAWARNLAAPAIVVPSAALPGTRNLVLFGERIRAHYGVSPTDPTLYVPCDPVADLALVVDDLLTHVRWRGDHHAGLDAWRQGLPAIEPPAVTVSRRF